MKPPKMPISKGMLVLLLMFSVLVDIVQLILDFIVGPGWLVNAIIDFFVGAIFFVWFKILGVKFSKGPLVSFIAGFVIDLVPFLDCIGWTTDVILVYISISAKYKAQVATIEKERQEQENRKFLEYQKRLAEKRQAA